MRLVNITFTRPYDIIHCTVVTMPSILSKHTASTFTALHYPHTRFPPRFFTTRLTPDSTHAPARWYLLRWWTVTPPTHILPVLCAFPTCHAPTRHPTLTPMSSTPRFAHVYLLPLRALFYAPSRQHRAPTHYPVLHHDIAFHLLALPWLCPSRGQPHTVCSTYPFSLFPTPTFLFWAVVITQF